MSIKTCRTCGEDKNLTDFPIHQGEMRKLDCKVCFNAMQKARRLGKPRTEESRKYRAKHGEAKREYNRIWHSNNKERAQDKKLVRSYGITSKDRALMFEKQNGLCAICNKPGKLVVDHDHKTLKVRGLLHANCNAALGLLQDSVEVVTSAASYLATKGIF